MGVKVNPGGQIVFFGMVNLLVHMFMYLYYFAAACGPNSPLQRFLWMKKYLTIMQLVQFIMVFIQNSAVIIGNCGYPLITIGQLPVSAMFIIMFGNFYIKAYMKGRKAKSID